MSDIQIGEGSRVKLHFSLKLEDGQEVDSTFDGEPASFTVGDGNLPAGFEETLYGLKSGEQNIAKVSPEKAFGMPNPENVRQFSRQQFGDDMELIEGMVLNFADAAKNEVPGTIISFDAEYVEVDFNHPLAGRTLLFEVRILDVEF